MKSTMQTTPLLISNLLRFGTTVHADSTVTTWKADGPEITTYGEVGKISARLANALRGMGITGDQRVGTFMWNNTEHLAAYLAVPSMGAVLHAINIRLFPEQLIYTAQHGGSEVVIVDDSLAEPFSQVLPHLTNVRHVIINGTDVSDEVCASMAALDHIESVRQWDELLAGQIDTFDWPEDLDENCASSMCYTSGTTGNPKGVVYSHRSNYLHATGVTAALGIGQAEKFLVVVPLFHANAWGYPYCAMTSGASLVMPGKYLQPEPLAQMIRDLKITTGAGVPTVWNALLQYLDANEEADVSTCRMLMIGGSAAPPSMMKAFQDRHSIEIIHGWGMTEMSPVGSLASSRRRRVRVEGVLGLPRVAGPVALRCRGARHGTGRADPALGQRECRRDRGARAVDHRFVLLQRHRVRERDRRRGSEIRRRLATHGRRRQAHPRRIPGTHRPIQGRHQVRW